MNGRYNAHLQHRYRWGSIAWTRNLWCKVGDHFVGQLCWSPLAAGPGISHWAWWVALSSIWTNLLMVPTDALLISLLFHRWLATWTGMPMRMVPTSSIPLRRKLGVLPSLCLQWCSNLSSWMILWISLPWMGLLMGEMAGVPICPWFDQPSWPVYRWSSHRLRPGSCVSSRGGVARIVHAKANYQSSLPFHPAAIAFSVATELACCPLALLQREIVGAFDAPNWPILQYVGLSLLIWFIFRRVKKMVLDFRSILCG